MSSRRHLWLAAGLLLLALAASLASRMLLVARAPHTGEAQQAQRVWIQLQPGAQWQSVDLPDIWKLSRPGHNGRATYRLTFELQAGLQQPAIYIPRWSMTGALTWDGLRVDAPSRWDGAAPRQLNQPRLYRLPPGSAAPGRHVAEIELQTLAAVHGGLSRVYVGEYQVLAPLHQQMQFWQPMAQQAIGLSAFFLAFMVLALTHALREPGFAYAGLSMLTWALSVFGWSAETAWIGASHWELLYYSARICYPYLIGLFLYQFFHLQLRWMVPALLGTWAAAIVYTVSTWPQGFAAHSSLLFALPGVFFLWLLVATIIRGVRRAESETIVVASVLLMAHGLNLHDLSWWSGQTDFAEPMLSHFAGVLLFGCVVYMVLRRYRTLHNHLRSLNLGLEQQVHRRTQEALSAAAQTQRLQQERLLQEEREQIYRDLHDDIGAKLLTLAISAPTPVQAQTARSALQDLRAMVSHSSQGPQPLAYLLADLRSEAATRAANAGLAFAWEAPDYPLDAPGPALLPSAALDIARVLREAVSNVIKHARARRMQVWVRVDAEALSFCLRDDGSGCAADAGQGQGRNNMALRCARWSGRADWSAAPGGGCQVNWVFSLPAIVHQTTQEAAN